MKCADLKSFLERALAFRSLDTTSDEARSVQAFFPILDTYASKKAVDFAKLVGAAVPENSSQHSEIAQLKGFLQSLSDMLGDQAKLITADLQAVGSALSQHSDSNFAALSSRLSGLGKTKRKPKPKDPAARDEVVMTYVRRLEEALGDDGGFNAVFNALQKDENVSGVEIIAIAKKFSTSTTKSRKSALAKISARHQAIMVSRAKSAATAGRIAG